MTICCHSSSSRRTISNLYRLPKSDRPLVSILRSFRSSLTISNGQKRTPCASFAVSVHPSSKTTRSTYMKTNTCASCVYNVEDMHDTTLTSTSGQQPMLHLCFCCHFVQTRSVLWRKCALTAFLSQRPYRLLRRQLRHGYRRPHALRQFLKALFLPLQKLWRADIVAQTLWNT
jgi:hypothetical protein